MNTKLLAIATAMTFCPLIVQAQSYTITALPMEQGVSYDSYAWVNNNGTVGVVGAYPGANQNYTVTGSTVTALNTYQSNPTYLTGISNAGAFGSTQTGTSALFGPLNTAVIWNGSTPSLVNLGGSSNSVIAMNDGGEIAGNVTTFVGSVTVTHAVTYKNGQLTQLTTPGNGTYSSSGVNSINASGVVGGSISPNGFSSSIAAVWSSTNQLTQIGMISGSDQFGTVAGINDSGEAVVQDEVDINDVSQGAQSAVWLNGVLTNLGSAGGNETFAGAINNSGVVIGSTTDAGGNLHAFVWSSSTGMVLLDSLLQGTGFTRINLNNINNAGQIAGIAYNANTGENEAVLLTPTSAPEPVTITLLAGGAFALLRRRKR